MMRLRGKFRQARLNYQAKLGRTVAMDEVAEHVGVSKQSISNYELGNKIPSLEVFLRLCHLYGVGIYDLVEVYQDE